MLIASLLLFGGIGLLVGAYLYAKNAPREPWTRGRIVKAVVFWLLVVLIPVLVIQFSGPGAPRPSP